MLLQTDDPGGWLDPKSLDKSEAPRPDRRFRWKQNTDWGHVGS